MRRGSGRDPATAGGAIPSQPVCVVGRRSSRVGKVLPTPRPLDPVERGVAQRRACEWRRARSRIGQAGAWDRVIVPFFRDVWPRERKFQTPATTRALVQFLEKLGERFPKGFALVADFLVQSKDTDIFVFTFGSDRAQDHGHLTAQFPNETLSLLYLIIDQTHSSPPYGLAEVMTRLAAAAPELRHDERWQRLHRFSLF